MPHEILVDGNRFNLDTIEGRMSARMWAYSTIAAGTNADLGRAVLNQVGKEG